MGQSFYLYLYQVGSCASHAMAMMGFSRADMAGRGGLTHFTDSGVHSKSSASGPHAGG